MNEAERLAYLDTMGIDSYVPRVSLPGALPSVLCQPMLCEMPLDGVAEEAFETKSVVQAEKNSLKELQGSLVGQKSGSLQSASKSKQPSASSTTPATQISVRFHWAIFQPVPEMLLLIPVAHTDRNGLELLKKILAAVGIVNIPLSAIENFVWPPLSNQPAQKITIGNSLDDARETLQAFLEGYQLKQKQQRSVIKNILVFDGNLGKTIFESMHFPDMQVRILPSLHLMLTSSPEKIAEAKQLTWQRLKDLKA